MKQTRKRRVIAVRLFLTCWLIYGLHFATNIPREVFPAMALGDNWSFRVDQYGGMHPDIFNADDVDGLRNDEQRWGFHIGNNPGVSMLAAIPYSIARPVINALDARIQAGRKAAGTLEPPAYDSQWPMAQQFFAEAYRRGLDIRLGLGAWVMHAFLMAPSSALGVVLVFLVIGKLTENNKLALALALLYAFGTPVFFRTGFLNHNLMLGHIAFAGFLLMWRYGWTDRSGPAFWRAGLCGLAAGTTVLFDYSGVVVGFFLFLYCIARRVLDAGVKDALKHAGVFVLGSLPPMFTLWYYQWSSFGHPFYPGQHWMPPVEWIELGYQGYAGPQLDLLWMLGFDFRFGLFIACPLFLLAWVSPFFNRGKIRVPGLEFWFMLMMTVGLWVFFSGSHYTKLQFNTGIRYLAPVFPFIFIPVSIVMMRLPSRLAWFIGILSLALGWCTAMYRDVERGLGAADPVVRTFLGGFELPVIRTISNMGTFEHLIPNGASTLPLLMMTGVLVLFIWWPEIKRVCRNVTESKV